jgi:hypothetical protein
MAVSAESSAAAMTLADDAAKESVLTPSPTTTGIAVSAEELHQLHERVRARAQAQGSAAFTHPSSSASLFLCPLVPVPVPAPAPVPVPTMRFPLIGQNRAFL